MCGCQGDTQREIVPEVYRSVTSDNVPVSFKAYRYADDKLERQIINEALDKRIGSHALRTLTQNCDSIVIELKNHFGFIYLEMALEKQYNLSGLWPDNRRCPVIFNRPGDTNG